MANVTVKLDGEHLYNGQFYSPDKDGNASIPEELAIALELITPTESTTTTTKKKAATTDATNQS